MGKLAIDLNLPHLWADRHLSLSTGHMCDTLSRIIFSKHPALWMLHSVYDKMCAIFGSFILKNTTLQKVNHLELKCRCGV